MSQRSTNSAETGAATYTERLRPPLWGWLVLLSLSLCIAVAFGHPLGLITGIVTFFIFGGLSAWFLITTSVTISVTNEGLRVGRAHIDWEYTGIVATLDPTAAERARGVEADPRAFAVNRPLTAKAAITLEILDSEDPHPYWLISTAHPTELGRAIRSAQQTAQPGMSSQDSNMR